MPVVPIAMAAVVGVTLGMLGGGSIRHVPAGHRDVAGVQAIWALSMAPTHRRADLMYISGNTPRGNIELSTRMGGTPWSVTKTALRQYSTACVVRRVNLPESSR